MFQNVIEKKIGSVSIKLCKVQSLSSLQVKMVGHVQLILSVIQIQLNNNLYSTGGSQKCHLIPVIERRSQFTMNCDI